MDGWKKTDYRYFYGICICILIIIIIITFNHFGIFNMIGVITSLIAIPLISWLVKHSFESRSEENETSNEKIITREVVIGVILYSFCFMIERFIGRLSIFFHEAGHVLAALNFDIRILDVILSSFKGTTFLNLSDIENLTVIQHTIVAASGGCGVIIFGILLLLILHWNKEFPLIYYFPLTLLILTAVCSDLWYYTVGAINLIDDMGVILQLNPSINQYVIAFLALFGLVVMILFWIYSFFKHVKFMEVNLNEQ